MTPPISLNSAEQMLGRPITAHQLGEWLFELASRTVPDISAITLNRYSDVHRDCFIHTKDSLCTIIPDGVNFAEVVAQNRINKAIELQRSGLKISPIQH